MKSDMFEKIGVMQVFRRSLKKSRQYNSDQVCDMLGFLIILRQRRGAQGIIHNYTTDKEGEKKYLPYSDDSCNYSVDLENHEE